MKNTLFSIIIANFNGEKYLETCLNSVLKSSYKNFEIIIIDDASTDQSLDILIRYKSGGPKVIILENKKNIGPAASRNKALRNAKGSVIVFLDNDTEVTPSWLNEFNKLLKNKNIGAVQSLLLDFKKRNIIQMGGGRLISFTGWLKPLLQGFNYKGATVTDKDIVGVSAALAVKKSCFYVVKGFDEKEQKYTEDLDFCWRIWIAGFRVVLASKSIVYHYTKSIAERNNTKTSKFEIYYHMSKNSIRSMIKNYELKNIPLNLLFFIGINIIRSLLVLIRRKDASAFAGSMLGIVWNIISLDDTLKNRMQVQKTRVFSDKYLFSSIFDNSPIRTYIRILKESKLLW